MYLYTQDNDDDKQLLHRLIEKQYDIFNPFTSELENCSFIYFKSCLATAIQNFKWLKITWHLKNLGYKKNCATDLRDFSLLKTR